MKTKWIFFVLFFVGVGSVHYVVYSIAVPKISSQTLLPSYAIQGFFALLVVGLLYQTVRHYPNALAFIFMGLSLFKIVVFGLFFLPLLKADGSLSTIEKTDVLIPYFTTLFLETYWGMYQLNKL